MNTEGSKKINEISIKEILKKLKSITTTQDVQYINTIFQKGISLDQLLEEVSTGKYDDFIEHKGIENLSDLILVHKTKYVPEDGTIKTSKNAGAILEDTVSFFDEEFKYQIKSQRDTIHFTVNGEVRSHAAGDFSNRKYAILIPFENVDRNKIGSGYSVDTFIKGDLEIQPGGYILCPQSERENVVKETRNLIVIGYEGETVDEYANKFLDTVLGYKKENIKTHNWDDKKDQTKYDSILEKNNIRIRDAHGGTIEYSQELGRQGVDIFCTFTNILKDKIVDEESYNKFKEMMTSAFCQSGISPNSVMQTILNGEVMSVDFFFEQIQEQVGINIPQNVKEGIFEQYKNSDQTYAPSCRFTEELIESIVTEYRMQQISNEPVVNYFFGNTSISPFDQKLFFQKYIKIIENKGVHPNMLINQDLTVGELFEKLEDKEKSVTIEDLEENSKEVSAKERYSEPSKMKQLAKEMENEEKRESNDYEVR